MIGQPRAKHEIMSVPPEMEARQISFLIDEYTKRKLSSDSGDAVDVMIFSRDRSYFSLGINPAFSTEAIYFALVPNRLIPSSWAN